MCFVIAELLLAPSLEHWHAKSVLEDSQDLKSKSPVVPEKAGCLAGCLIPSHQASLKKPMSQEGRKPELSSTDKMNGFFKKTTAHVLHVPKVQQHLWPAGADTAVLTSFHAPARPGAALCRHSQAQACWHLPWAEARSHRGHRTQQDRVCQGSEVTTGVVFSSGCKYPSESDLEYATNHLLGKHKLLRPSE